MDTVDNNNLKLLQQLKEKQTDLRSLERNLQARQKTLYSQPMVASGNCAKNLEAHLKNILPEHLIPRNVGAYNSVSWPQWYQVDFDLGDNPTIGPSTRKTSYFQVTAEAAFVIMSIAKEAQSYTTSGALAPLEFEIRDRQSTRTMMSQPMPIQHLGSRSMPTVLPTPFLVMPSSFIDITLTSPQSVDLATVGSGVHQFSFFGYRIRVEDFEKVLSTVFRA